MNYFNEKDGKLYWSREGEQLEISAAGTNSLRIRGTVNRSFAEDIVGAIQPDIRGNCRIDIGENSAVICNGFIMAQVSQFGRIIFNDVITGKTILEEVDWLPYNKTIFPKSRQYAAVGGELYKVALRFIPGKNEHFYGLGQHRHGLLDQRGTVIDLIQGNGEVTIPFYVSSKRYGFIWNSPSLGRVELGISQIRWIANASRQIDYIVIGGGDYRLVMETYADITGHTPILPYWASGFWQSKLRYKTQEEVLTVAREYKRRNLPLSAIVIDYLHWQRMGEWNWDHDCWPDPVKMVAELNEMGVKTVVSVWPTVNPKASGFEEMKDRNLLIRTKRGLNLLFPFADTFDPPTVFMHYYDATNPEARKYLCDRLRENYSSVGIHNFWLDACEPEIDPADPDNLLFHLGDGIEVANAYPYLHQKGLNDFLGGGDPDGTVFLTRSAWLGSQKYGVALWSGDIESKWTTLKAQIGAGLNAMMSGILWWGSDVGGFFNGNIENPDFRELIVRWFQFGLFCPIFRIHGNREPRESDIRASGRDNEVWSFGEENYVIIREILLLRERLRPYIMEQMIAAANSGIPPMRPLFFDYPDDEECYQVDDEFLLGPDIIVAPIYRPGERNREVYLPSEYKWRDAWNGKPMITGSYFTADAPLAKIPAYIREGSAVTFMS
ncbi:MAG: glycoside hydrolase family 31 protein [Treponema sp.]|jgi:alpha-D-xyloside xylohydrolase|nr:glycoside hydrolase family 31 protein [Treponema sp.]